jgi:hypothetical protein
MPQPKLPKSLAQCADLLYKTREERYKAQRVVDKLAATEHALNEHFIANLPKSQATGIAGKLARVQVGTKPIPRVEDWPAFYLYIKKNNAFDLLQRRVNDGAIKERWEDKKQVPGVSRFNVVKVSCTALKGK